MMFGSSPQLVLARRGKVAPSSTERDEDIDEDNFAPELRWVALMQAAGADQPAAHLQDLPQHPLGLRGIPAVRHRVPSGAEAAHGEALAFSHHKNRTPKNCSNRRKKQKKIEKIIEWEE